MGDIRGATAVAKTILAADPGHAAARRVASVSTVQPDQLLQLLQASNGLPGLIVQPETLEQVANAHRVQRLYSGVSLVVDAQTAAGDNTPAVQLVARNRPEGAAGAEAGARGYGQHGGDWQNESMDNVLAGWSAEERLIIKLDELTWAALAKQVFPQSTLRDRMSGMLGCRVDVS